MTVFSSFSHSRFTVHTVVNYFVLIVLAKSSTVGQRRGHLKCVMFATRYLITIVHPTLAQRHFLVPNDFVFYGFLKEQEQEQEEFPMRCQ